MTLDLKKLIVSPNKRAHLVEEKENTLYFQDETQFPIVNGIPVLIDEQQSLFLIADITNQVPQTQDKAYADQNSFKNFVRRKLLPKLSIDSEIESRYEKLAEAAKGLPVLIVGAGDKVEYYKRLFHQSAIITSDVHLQFGPDIVFDIHQIPFPDNYFSLIIAGQVLEHTVKPWQAAEEMQRVSALNGIIQIEVPFGFPYHAAPYDFFRFTFSGLRSLFSSCLLNDYKASEGIFSAAAVINAQALMELWKNKYLKYSMLVIGRLAFFWMKYIDTFKSGRSFSDFIMPKGYYMTFRKDGVKRSDAECLKDFNTLQKNQVKILHVIDRLNAGGAERVCIDLANVSFDHGLSVSILVLLDESRLDSTIHPGVKVYYLRRNSKLTIKKYLEAAAICRHYDIIHVHMRHVFRYMTVINLLVNLKAKLILHDHFGDIRTHKQIPFLFGSVFKPRYYVGVSSELTAWAIQCLKMNTQNVFLLANIIRQSKINNSEKLRDLVVVSNIRRTKNIGFAIRVAASLNLTMDIIGQVVDVTYYEELIEIIRLHHAEARIRFIHNCFDVQFLLGDYKMALHTASSETGPLVLMEYLAQGKNFLAYKTGEVAETIHHTLPDFFIDNFDLEMWKNKILHTMRNPLDRDTLIAIFRQNFNEEKYFELCLKIYQYILRS